MLYENVKLSTSKRARSYPYRGPVPSNLSSCKNLVWYLVHMADILEDHPTSLQLLFDEGHAQEEFMVNQLRKVGYTIPEESRNERYRTQIGRHTLNLRIDGRIKGLNLGDTQKMLELKSMSPWAFQRFLDLGAEAVPYYIDQMLPCMLATGLEGILYAKNRDSADVYDIAVPFDQDRIDCIEKVLDDREEVLAGSEPVGHPHPRGSFQCKGCPAYKRCWSMPSENEGISIEDLPETDRKEAIEKAVRYGELAVQRQEQTTENKELRDFFEGILFEHKTKSLTVSTNVGLVVRPHLVDTARHTFNEDRFSLEHPDLYRAYKYMKPGTQLRFEIRWKGQLISS